MGVGHHISGQPTLALGLKKKISAIATKIVTQTAFKPTKVVDLCGVGSYSQDLLGFDSRRVAEQVARASQRNQVVALRATNYGNLVNKVYQITDGRGLACAGKTTKKHTNIGNVKYLPSFSKE